MPAQPPVTTETLTPATLDSCALLKISLILSAAASVIVIIGLLINYKFNSSFADSDIFVLSQGGSQTILTSTSSISGISSTDRLTSIGKDSATGQCGLVNVISIETFFSLILTS